MVESHLLDLNSVKRPWISDFWLKLVFYIYFCQLNDFGAFVRNRSLVEQFYLILHSFAFFIRNDQRFWRLIQRPRWLKSSRRLRDAGLWWLRMTVWSTKWRQNEVRICAFCVWVNFAAILSFCWPKRDLNLFLMNFKANLCRCMNFYRQGEIWERA